MADFISLCRTNYVRPKNRAAFVSYLEAFNDVVIIEKDGAVGFYSSCLPSRDTEDDECSVIECAEEIAALISDNEVLIVMLVGNEKARYLEGWAWAIHASGRSEELCLNDIYQRAADAFTVDEKSISRCSY